MADDRILVSYSMSEKDGVITRSRSRGNDLIDSKTVARYDPDTQTLFFKNAKDVEQYKLGVTTFLSTDEKNVRHYQREDLELDPPLTKAIPPRPKKTRHEGDKTPAVVEWYMKFRPNEFETRYEVLGHYTGMVSHKKPNWEPRPKDGVLEFRGELKYEEEMSNVLVTRRKTHLSFTPEECVDWDPEDEMDDDRRGEAPAFKPAGRVGESTVVDDDDDPPQVAPGTRAKPKRAVRANANIEQE